MTSNSSFNRVTMLFLSVVLTSCAMDPAEGFEGDPAVTFELPDPTITFEEVDVDDGAYVEDLASRYLFLEVDEEEARSINDEIRALSPNEMRLFSRELLTLGTADEYVTVIASRLTERAINQGVGLFDLTEDDLRIVIDEIGYSYTWPSHEDDPSVIRALAICLPGQESCTVWSPGSTTSLYGFNSTNPGTTASWSDRQSTSSCEWGGCDHRFYFTGTLTLIDGKTTAYDNWIASYTSILGSHTGSATYALMGNGQAILNGIYWVNASQVKGY